ncbi:hypothetical protein [Microbacterium sp. H1-D42]|uniref:hypothetical protein n=1 Tax=Microbacterium sp. H1-D42 TaxID=2925844 RepID=UPI001F5375D2|nr:hypothetical protein [Microbacterium sp. H1-D42]UNK70650.1 hypothetical protein MNR00_16055 [Microbacterium sp. H1-D42]
MGLFTQKPQEPSAWAALPGEPLDETDPAKRLDDVPGVGLNDFGLGAQYTTVVLPVTPPTPEAVDTSENDGE